MIAATATDIGASNAVHTELLRQQLATASHNARDQRNSPEGRRITSMRRQMESIAVAHAITGMVVQSCKIASSRIAQLSKVSSNSEDDGNTELLLELIDLQRNVESFGTRLIPMLSSLVVKAAGETGLYKPQIEAEKAHVTGYASAHDVPSWTKPIFDTARTRAETERRVAQLVRIQRSKSKPPAAYYDGPSLADASNSLRLAADALEEVLVVLSAAEQLAESDELDTFFREPTSQKQVGAKEHLDGALNAIEETLDTLAAIDPKLPSQVSGGVSPALARAFAGAASPVSKAVASRSMDTASDREPLVSMNLSKNPAARPARSSSSPAGVSIVWSFGSDAKATAYQSPLRTPAATARLRSTPSALSPRVEETGRASPRPAAASPQPAYSSPLRGLSSAVSKSPRGLSVPLTGRTATQSRLAGSTEPSHQRVALQNLMRSSSIPSDSGASAGLVPMLSPADTAPTATAALASGVAAETVADAVSRQLSSVGSPGALGSASLRPHLRLCIHLRALWSRP